MSLLKSYLTDYPWSLRLSKARWWKHGKRLIAIERACFDEQMQSEAHDLRTLIKDNSVLAMVLFDGNTMVGYMAGVPLESDSSSFDLDTDPPLGWGEHDTIYVDNISILPEHRNKNNMKFMVAEFIRHSRAAGYLRATTHARKSNGLSAYCIRRLKFKKLKTIPNWYECGEDFDYIAMPEEVLAQYDSLPRWHTPVVFFKQLFSGGRIERYFREE